MVVDSNRCDFVENSFFIFLFTFASASLKKCRFQYDIFWGENRLGSNYPASRPELVFFEVRLF
jgi:hypothetical protein